GHVPLGIVYRTDASRVSSIEVLDSFPENAMPPIHYSIALVSNPDNDARKWFKALTSTDNQNVYEEFGFKPVSNR
ncbi:MAG: substrate-binding domain-containing protein, partial [bacterium]